MKVTTLIGRTLLLATLAGCPEPETDRPPPASAEAALTLVEEFIRRDGIGERLASPYWPGSSWFDSVTMDKLPKGGRPGSFVVTKGHEVIGAELRSDTVYITVVHEIVDRAVPAHGGGWELQAYTGETAEAVFRVVKTSAGLRIASPLPAPHVRAQTVAWRQDLFMASSRDSRRITEAAGEQRKPFEEILFVTPHYTLCTVRRDGSGLFCRIPSDHYTTVEPAWRPGANELAVVAWSVDEVGSPGPIELWLMDERGQLLRRFEGSTSYTKPVWSTDGESLYSSSYDLRNAVARWNADGTNRTIIPVTGTDTPDGRLTITSFSPSGKRATFVLYFPSTRERDLLLAHVTEAYFVVDPESARGISGTVIGWLDEEHFLFTSGNNLLTLNAATGEITEIDLPGVRITGQGAISPDRQSILISAHDGLWIYDLGGWVATRLVSGPAHSAETWRAR